MPECGTPRGVGLGCLLLDGLGVRLARDTLAERIAVALALATGRGELQIERPLFASSCLSLLPHRARGRAAPGTPFARTRWLRCTCGQPAREERYLRQVAGAQAAVECVHERSVSQTLGTWLRERRFDGHRISSVRVRRARCGSTAPRSQRCSASASRTDAPPSSSAEGRVSSTTRMERRTRTRARRVRRRRTPNAAGR